MFALALSASKALGSWLGFGGIRATWLSWLLAMVALAQGLLAMVDLALFA